MVESLDRQIARERKAAHPHAEDVQVYRRYAEGDHDATLTADQKAILGTAARHVYADNLADMVLSAWASRLLLTGFRVESAPVQEFLDDLFVRNALGDLSYDCNYATGRDGNHALMLRWLPDDRADLPADPTDETADLPPGRSAGRVTVHAEDWWDGKTGVWVAYDDRGRPSYAVKEFQQAVVDADGNARERKRRTVYWPDRIQRLIADGNGWQPYPLPGEPEDGIVPWLKRDGTPLGIPVVHFSFPRFGKRRYGVSELAGGFLANQDHVNDVQQDLTAAARLLGFQILWATGAKFDTAPQLMPGAFLHTEKDAAKFGAIPSGDLKQLIDAHGTKLQTVARMTATPIHVITGGDWPAGIALVQAEKPLIAKVMRLAKAIGPAWATVAHRATEMANAFGGVGLDEDALVTAVFADPEQLDQLAQAEVQEAKAKALIAIEALTDVWSMEQAGVPPEVAARIVRDREARQEAMDERLTGVAAGNGGQDDDEDEDEEA